MIYKKKMNEIWQKNNFSLICASHMIINRIDFKIEYKLKTTINRFDENRFDELIDNSRRFDVDI